MNRPQSAKPGHKGLWGQSSADDINDHNITNNQKNPNRKNVKILKPDLTTHEFARILPRKIHQDKERLYSQALTLKQSLNEVVEQNIRLKTKISILQKQKLQMNRYIESTPDGMGVKGNSRINIYNNKSSEKDNMITRNLKKIVRELREEKETLQYQNQKTKKMIKYTKINQLQIESKLIYDENKRLNSIIQELSNRYMDQEELLNENEELKRYLQEQIQQKNKLKQEHNKYEEIIENLQQKIKIQNEKYANKQKKILRDLNGQKRKCMTFQRRNDQLSRQLNNLRQNQLFIEQNKKKIIAKPAPRLYNKINTNSSQPEMNNQINKQWQIKYQSLKTQNQSLQKQLRQTRQKLKKAEEQMYKNVQKQRNELNQNSIIKDSNNDKSKLSYNDSKIQQNRSNISQLSQKDQNQDDYHEDYEEQVQIQPIKKNLPQNNNQNNEDEGKLQKFKKDFEENQEQQELYSKKSKSKTKKNKQQALSKQQGKGKQKDKKKKKKTQNKEEGYKPNKAILAQIKELLTYRMKSQRYPFNDLKSDIQAAQTDIFSYADLCNMLINQPFYLTSQYTKVFLQYCYEKQKILHDETITNSHLVTKLRKCVDDFALMDQNQEKQMIVRIAEMTSTYPRELQIAFQNIKNGQETVARKDLIQMFQKLELEDKYIELIISQLSLCSDDLQHLNFHGFFQRFYIEDENDYIQNEAIQQQGQESEQSYKNSSRAKKNNVKKTNKASNKHSDNEDTKKPIQHESDQKRQDNESI